MKVLYFALSLAIFVASRGEDDDFVEDVSDDISSSSIFGDVFDDYRLEEDEGSGVEPTPTPHRPHRECVRQLKECYAGESERKWVDKHTCRLGFCECRRKVCENYFRSRACHSNSWCSLKKVCSKSFKACKYSPRKESKCRRKLRRCLKGSGDNKKDTKKCLKSFSRCLPGKN